MSDAAEPNAWLFSRERDIAVFGGSALLSFLFLLLGALGSVGARAMPGSGETPTWAWVPAVLMVDVAHVWATGFRVYFDPRELARRPALYLLTPLVAHVVLFRLYALGPAVFWRCLAYLAIFHFVRQQAGWVALYRARAGERDTVTRFVDDAAIYAATLYPLVYWHTHTRSFDWFVAGDVGHLPAWVDRVAFPLYLVALLAYAARAIARHLRGLRGSPGKDLVVLTTAACWYVGIVVLDSDYAFTVTNVFIHGIPYVALVYAYGRAQPDRSWRSRLVVILATIWALAYFEELLWDRSLWAERPSLFGSPWSVRARLGDVELALVPLLAVPQVTHYVLDGFLWRRRDNPGLARLFRAREAPAPGLRQATVTSLG